MKKELNKYLNSLSEKELIQEIRKLYDKFNSVKKYYELELSDNSGKVLTEFKSEKLEPYFRFYCQDLIDKTYNFGWGVYYDLVAEFKELLID